MIEIEKSFDVLPITFISAEFLTVGKVSQLSFLYLVFDTSQDVSFKSNVISQNSIQPKLDYP